MIRSSFNKSENRRLIEKSQRLESIVEAMKDRGETEEYIAEVRFCQNSLRLCAVYEILVFVCRSSKL